MRSTLHAPISPLLALVACLGFACTLGSDTIIGPDGTEEEVPSGSPQLSINITVMDFGDVSYGQSYSESLHVENVGGDDLVLSAITATDPFSANYASDVTVTPGGSTTLVVRYQPVEYAEHEGSFSLSWNADEDDTAVDAGYWEIPLYGSVITDEDGDGHDSLDAGGDDCDDADDGTYPGAAETWYDGTDQDCLEDDDYDQDGDGYQVSAYQPEWSSGGGDCNDANAEVYPGAPDYWYDNLDSNCDESDDWDQDGDGYRTTLGDEGTDCDDENSAVNPGAEEDDTNGIDDDCDGRVDET